MSDFDVIDRNHYPLVSIIMPAFNAESTIGESIESVLSQSYNNFELLIINDNSSDSTQVVVSQYSDHRIRFLENRFGKGAAGARKTGILSACGDYIAFLDSDDLWGKNKLYVQTSFMLANEFDFTYTDYVTFSENGTYVKTISPPDKYNYEDLLACCNIGCLTVIISRRVTIGLNYDCVPKEDYAYWLKVLKKVTYAYKCDGVISYYRVQRKSLSSSKFKELFRQWYVIKNIEKIPVYKSLYYIFHYIVNGIVKHW